MFRYWVSPEVCRCSSRGSLHPPPGHRDPNRRTWRAADTLGQSPGPSTAASQSARAAAVAEVRAGQVRAGQGWAGHKYRKKKHTHTHSGNVRLSKLTYLTVSSNDDSQPLA